jgi:hypothetical protein
MENCVAVSRAAHRELQEHCVAYEFVSPALGANGRIKFKKGGIAWLG